MIPQHDHQRWHQVILLLIVLSTLLAAGCVLKKDNRAASPQLPPPAVPGAEPAGVVPVPAVQPAPSAPLIPAPEPAAAPSTPPVQAAAEPVIEPSAENVAVPTMQEMDKKVQTIITKAKEKTGLGYSFYYTTTNNWELWRDQYFVKDNFIKIKLYSVNLYDRENYFNTVYLDTSRKTAVGYCEDPSRCLDMKREFTLDYMTFIIPTPRDWIDELTYAKWIGAEQFDNRLSNVIEYKRIGGDTVRVWVDSYSGVPVQVLIYGEDVEDVKERYGYRDLTVSISSKQVRHEPIS